MFRLMAVAAVLIGIACSGDDPLTSEIVRFDVTNDSPEPVSVLVVDNLSGDQLQLILLSDSTSICATIPAVNQARATVHVGAFNPHVVTPGAFQPTTAERWRLIVALDSTVSIAPRADAPC